MYTNEIMDDIHHDQDNLPILTEIIRPESLSAAKADKGIVNLQLATIEPDPRGYDPYNNAPPVPADKEAFS